MKMATNSNINMNINHISIYYDYNKEKIERGDINLNFDPLQLNK